MGQIIKSSKTINGREYTLYGVDAEICFYLLSNQSMNSMVEYSELEKYLYLCLGNVHHTYIKDVQYFMNLLLTRALGFDCSELNSLLSKYEQTGKFYKSYRDHYVHQLRVYLTGVYLMNSNGAIRDKLVGIYGNDDKVLKIWTIASLTHDWGYVFEWGNPAFSTQHSESLKVLNKFTSDPISLFFTEVGSKFLPKQKENILRDASINLGQVTSFSNIKNDVIVKDAFNTIENYAALTNLGGDTHSGLQNYYDFFRSYTVEGRENTYCDHGIVSAYILLWLAHLNWFYKEKISCKIFKDTQKSTDCIEDAKQAFDMAVNAASAIALHNIRPHSLEMQDKAYDEFGLTLNNFKITFEQTPLAYLLVFSDSLQEWERPSYLAENDQDFQAQDMHIFVNDANIYLCFPTDYIALSKTKGSRFEKIKTSIDELLFCDNNLINLCEVDINEFIKQLKNSSAKQLIHDSRQLPITDEKVDETVQAYELYIRGRHCANEANFELAIQLQSEAAQKFKKLKQYDWEARALGRVAFSSIYYGVSEEKVSAQLELACKLDKWQGTGNYYWIIDHCLKSNTTEKTKLKFFSSLLEMLDTLHCINRTDFYGSSDVETRMIMYRSALLLFFEQLIQKERAANWPDWSMSDIPRMYVLRAEENPIASINYLSMAESSYKKVDLTSYAAWTSCKKKLLSINVDNDINAVMQTLNNILLDGRKILQSPGKERDIIKFYMVVISFYYELIKYSLFLSESYESCKYFLEAMKSYSIYERDEYIRESSMLIDYAEKLPTRNELSVKAINSLNRFQNPLAWIETNKIKELIMLHMKSGAGI